MSVERARSGVSFSVELAFSNEPLIFVGCSFKPEDSPIKNEGRPRLRSRSGPAGSGTATRVPAEDFVVKSKVILGRIDLIVHGGGAKSLEQGLPGRLDHLQVALGTLLSSAVTNPGAPS